MRVYLPATSSTLRVLLAERLLATPETAFAVTPGLREWYADGETEELEFAATMEAARASLRLLELDADAARRRVVLAADVPEAGVSIRDDLDRGVVRIKIPMPIADVAAVLVDDADAEPTVRRAADAIDAADLGDPAAQEVVDDVEGFELSWYATQEIEQLVSEVHGRDNHGSAT